MTEFTDIYKICTLALESWTYPEQELNLTLEEKYCDMNDFLMPQV